ncbi:MAG: substrate-binding domain-containing protein [Caldimonas sp.]
MLRRRFLLTAALAFAGPGAAQARAARSRGGPLLVGVDRALFDSGLAPALKRSFGADTGIAVKLVAAPAFAVLEAMQNGELDAALTNAPGAESDLERQGLVHARLPVASGEFVIVGPAARGPGQPTAPSRSGTSLLAALREATVATPGSVVFLTAGDRSGTHIAEQALWTRAQISPLAPWYQTADAGRPFIAQVRASGAFAVVERGAWVAVGGAPQAILVDADPALAETVHVMRSFHATHPAGKIFASWVGGRRGRSVAAAQRGYRAV